MGRRRQKNELGEELFALLVVVLLGIWAFITVLKTVSIVVVLAVIAGIAAIVTRKLLRFSQLRRSALAKVSVVIERHMDPLVRKWAQLVRSDAYGKVLLDKWDKEVEYFIKNHLAPVLTVEERSALHDQGLSLARLVTERVEAAARKCPLFEAFSNNLSPADFEIFCAEQLRSSGWDARVTLQSRDQGVDVVAEKAGIRVVLQCKLYSNPVGQSRKKS